MHSKRTFNYHEFNSNIIILKQPIWNWPNNFVPSPCIVHIFFRRGTSNCVKLFMHRNMLALATNIGCWQLFMLWSAKLYAQHSTVESSLWSTIYLRSFGFWCRSIDKTFCYLQVRKWVKIKVLCVWWCTLQHDHVERVRSHKITFSHMNYFPRERNMSLV